MAATWRSISPPSGVDEERPVRLPVNQTQNQVRFLDLDPAHSVDHRSEHVIRRDVGLADHFNRQLGRDVLQDSADQAGVNRVRADQKQPPCAERVAGPLNCRQNVLIREVPIRTTFAIFASPADSAG